MTIWVILVFDMMSKVFSPMLCSLVQDKLGLVWVFQCDRSQESDFCEYESTTTTSASCHCWQ
jgi:hypothetical protein